MKILYNITFLIEDSKHDDWMEWINTVYIPKIVEKGNFSDFKLSKILGVDEAHGIHYSLQLMNSSEREFKAFQDAYEEQFHMLVSTRYQERCMFFATVMKVVEES